MSSAVIAILIVLVGMYFLPFVIAALRMHHQSGAIFVLNLLLGWTFLGWIVALVWSFTSKPPPPQIIVVPEGKMNSVEIKAMLDAAMSKTDGS